MEKDFLKFDHKEKIAFDKAYPSKEIERFINGGGDDPVEIFKSLKTFDFPDIKPEAKDIVLAHFSESRFGPQLNMHDGQNGEVMIYRREIIPLLRASQDVFWQIFDLFIDGTKKSFEDIMSGTKKAEADWKK